jgi:nicotinamidase-related amidase
MRLPADATLIVVGAPDPAGDATARANIAALIEAWRREDLPAVDARALDAGPFDDGRLEARLEDLGATTLVLCGEDSAVDRAAREATALGFHAFVVRDACWRNGASATAAGLGQSGAVVDVATALAAAAVAKARQRRDGRRPQ